MENKSFHTKLKIVAFSLIGALALHCSNVVNPPDGEAEVSACTTCDRPELITVVDSDAVPTTKQGDTCVTATYDLSALKSAEAIGASPSASANPFAFIVVSYGTQDVFRPLVTTSGGGIVGTRLDGTHEPKVRFVYGLGSDQSCLPVRFSLVGYNW